MVKAKLFHKKGEQKIGYNDIDCICRLQDGRIAICADRSIQIYSYSNNIFIKSISIEISKKPIKFQYLTQLSNSLLLAAYSSKIAIVTVTKDSYIINDTISTQFKNISQIIEISNYRLGMCGDNPFINIYNGIRPYNKMIALYNNCLYVRAILEIKEKNAIIAAINGRLQIWNLISRAIETIIDEINCTNCNSLMKIANNKIIVGGYNTISVIDLKNYIVNVEKIEGEVESLIELRDGEIAMSTVGKKSQLFKYNVLLHKLSMVSDKIHPLSLDGKLIVYDTSTFIIKENNSLNIWNY